ncbi:hypothetical protein KBW71_27945, partial [Hydrogenophaga aromaticivorans]|uniref:hypothetical protein n=1 Tax=Hydrogenophaga aromaticivorans TaxID=2610898 RepID=UPI001B39C271
PDDVAGQERHLRAGERDAGLELVGLREGHARFEQGAVLRFVVAEAAQEAPPGELGDLLASTSGRFTLYRSATLMSTPVW